MVIVAYIVLHFNETGMVNKLLLKKWPISMQQSTGPS